MTTLKSGVIGIISFLAVVGFSVPATTYAWVGDMNFSNIGNIYMPGYTVSSGVNPYSGMSYGIPRQQQGGTWGWTTSTYPARSFNPMTESFPIYYPDQSYGQSYGSGYSNYDYSSSYGGGYGSQFGYAQPTGDYDLIGQPLCQWYDYNGRTPCAYDPHQWIYDPYTGSWY
jgi:hypothetical protein